MLLASNPFQKALENIFCHATLASWLPVHWPVSCLLQQVKVEIEG
jgi:hypothetical protein